PVFVAEATGFITTVGDPITDEVDRRSVTVPAGTFAVWPLQPKGTEGLWGITPDTARRYHEAGYLRSRNYKPAKRYVAVQYLPSGTVAAIESGDAEVTGREEDGAVIAVYASEQGVIPKSVWNKHSPCAETGGVDL